MRGKPVEQRQVIHDTRGYLAELLSKCIHADTLDKALSKEDTSLLLDFLQSFGDLDESGKYVGSLRAGFTDLAERGRRTSYCTSL